MKATTSEVVYARSGIGRGALEWACPGCNEPRVKTFQFTRVWLVHVVECTCGEVHGVRAS